MKNYIYFLFFLILWIGCANVIPPSGGPQDITPPKLINADPQNRVVYFKENKITLFFDEYIALQNLENIKISPACNPPPKITLSGKKVEIELACLLDKQTTYTINFGKSITDINEGNILQNFKYVFSTGDYIDSLSIAGNVRSLYFNEKLNGVLVGLSNQIDSLTPYYYTFSKKNGDFLIDNIKQDEYIIFAILDENNNFQYDEGELIAKPETLVNLNITKNLGLFREKPKKHIHTVKNIYKNAILFEHALLEDSIIILNTPGLWSPSNHSSTFWFEKADNFITYKYQNTIDSIGIYNLDSVKIVELKLLSKLHEIYGDKNIIIKSNAPIKNIIQNRFLWQSNSNSIYPELVNPFTIKISVDGDLTKEEALIIQPNAIISDRGESNDSTIFYLNFNHEKYGSLNIKSLFSDTNLIIELFDDNNIIRKINLKDSLLIQWIKPGNYNLRVFIDDNKNNYWDPGGIKNLKISEKITVYPELITIRPNWELDLLLHSFD